MEIIKATQIELYDVRKNPKRIGGDPNELYDIIKMKKLEGGSIVAKKDKILKNTRSYKILRDYVKHVSGQTATELDLAIGEAIGQSDKTIQNISSGKRTFKWGEAKKAAEEFVLNAGEAGDKRVLYSLITDFLCNYGLSDPDAEVSEDDIHFYVAALLEIQNQIELEPTITQPRYNSLPELLFTGTIIRTELKEKIETAIKEQKIIFLSGITGTGKSFIAKTVAQEVFDNNIDEYKFAIWNECEGGKTTVNEIVANILVACGVKNTGNMTKDDKFKTAEDYMKQCKGILVIDGFEWVSNKGNDTEEVIHFITEKVPKNWITIVTCSKRLSLYRRAIKVVNRFREIKVEKLSFEEWVELSNTRANSLGDIKEAKEAFPNLDKFVYGLCKGNAYVMIHVLASVSEKLLTGTSFERIKNEYDLLDIDEESYQAVFEKTLKDLPENCLSLLVSMSLFATPVTSQILSLVSGIDGVEVDASVKEGSDLEQSILRCHNLYMIDRYIKDEKFRFCLPEMLLPILSRTLKDNEEEYQSIVERWISYYVQYSYKIGFCFDDFNRLSELDNDSNAREIDNILRVLGYCELMERWDDFYTISENTKYFFYTRGISGEGKESVHYKRACAARQLGHLEDEFDSLLYHCNVMCKAKSWKDIEECFDRMDELVETVDSIPERNKKKYKYLTALYQFFTGNIDKAICSFEEYEKDIKCVISKNGEKSCDKMLIHDYVASLRWHCECILTQISFVHKTEETEAIVTEMNNMLGEAIRLSKTVNFERAIVHSILIKIKINFELQCSREEILGLFNQLDKYKTIIAHDAVYRKNYNQYREQIMKEDG